jgi:hypothetical protein
MERRFSRLSEAQHSPKPVSRIPLSLNHHGPGQRLLEKRQMLHQGRPLCLMTGR